MTLERIDQALTEWQGRLSQAGASLLELDDSAAYQRLRGSAQKLTGKTQAQIGPALPLIDGLWQSQQQLTDIVNQAERLRPALGKLWAHETERKQIEFLLFGASVPLAPAEAPFARRGLLSGPDPVQAVTLDTVLAQMTQNFGVVKDAVVALETAWNRLDRTLIAANKEVDAIMAAADALGVGVVAELEPVRRDIAGLRQQFETDPLGTGIEAAQSITARLGQMRRQLDAVQQQRDGLDAGLRGARALLAELGRLEQAAIAALAECRDKIAGFDVAAPLPPTELTAWLTRIEAARQNRQWKPALVGLERWREAANMARTEIIARCASASAALGRREELRGLLRALQAKARAQAAHGTELDPSFAELARHAEQLLHGRPTPLDEAAALVSEYERRLAG